MKLLTALLFVFFAQVIRAQDVIYKVDGTEIEAVVAEITTTVIKYKKASNPDGPTYTLYKASVHKIVYANGDEEVFNELKKQEEQQPAQNTMPVETETIYYEENEAKERYKRYTEMGQDFFQFYYRNLSFFVEIGSSQVFAMRFSFYFNFNNKVDRPGFPLQHGFSVYPHFFMYNSKYFRAFMGPHFHHGFSRNLTTVVVDEYWDGNDYVPVYGEDTRWSWHTVFLAEPGVSITPFKSLDITIHGGVGFVHSFSNLGGNGYYYNSYDDDGVNSSVKLAWKVGITLGGKW